MARTANDYLNTIQQSGMTIYSPIDPNDTNLFIPTDLVEELLNNRLVGANLDGLASRTRSKVIKELVSEALGYPVPKSFLKTQPRFTGQDLDVYNQQALNLQIWNEPIIPTRRYALVRIDESHIVRAVRVVLGEELIPLDRSGRLTTKYQAQVPLSNYPTNLLSASDTYNLIPLLAEEPTDAITFAATVSPVAQPVAGQILPIREIFRRLSALVGTTFPDAGRNQDRNRGWHLHRMVCDALGYQSHQDNGQFPDIKHQLLEVKLQTSPTVDLGHALPDSIAAIEDVHIQGMNDPPRICDTRYAVFTASVIGSDIRLDKLFLTTGEDFFKKFRQFQGLVQNSKIQIPLPRSLFGE